MLNFPQLEPDFACKSLVRRGVTALIADGCAGEPRDDARSHNFQAAPHGAGHRGRDRRIRRARDRPQRSFFGETAEGWGMNFAAQSTKSCCFSTVPLLLDWLQDIVHRRYDRISRILKRGVYVVELKCSLTRTPLIRSDMEARNPSRIWHIASFRCDAEFDRYRGIADMAGPTTGSTRQRMTQR